jgi:hypothetical protein
MVAAGFDLYVNLVAKGAPKFFKTVAPRLTGTGYRLLF